MKACILKTPAPVETNPLSFADVPLPQPADGEVLVRVTYCGVCRTDLHVVEGEVPPRKSPVIPGHQVVGVIEAPGKGAGHKFPSGSRVGIAWLHHTDGTCEYCRAGAENLCDDPAFTGYTLKRLLSEYIRYYHDDRTHLGLSKETPGGRVRSAARGGVVSHARLGGLHHRYDRAA